VESDKGKVRQFAEFKRAGPEKAASSVRPQRPHLIEVRRLNADFFSFRAERLPVKQRFGDV
jgi:hypothetical protein